MTGVLSALGRAFASLMHPRLLLLSVLPTLAAALFWGALTLYYWSPLNIWLVAWLKNSTAVDWVLYAARVMFEWDVNTLLPGLARFLILLTVLPLIQASALLLTALCAMPYLLKHVATRSYPGLELRRGGSFAGSALSALFGSVVFICLWVVTLPLWLIPGLALVLPLALSAYVNQRMFCYDAVADHADREELKSLLHGHRIARYGLGAVLGVVHFVPLLGWFAPVYVGLAYIHWGLARIAAMRAAALRHATVAQETD